MVLRCKMEPEYPSQRVALSEARHAVKSLSLRRFELSLSQGILEYLEWFSERL